MHGGVPQALLSCCAMHCAHVMSVELLSTLIGAGAGGAPAQGTARVSKGSAGDGHHA